MCEMCIVHYNTSIENSKVSSSDSVSSSATCSEGSLLKPLDSLTNWLSSAVTCCSDIPAARPPLLCTLFSGLWFYWRLCSSTSVFLAAKKFDGLLGFHGSACQCVHLHLLLPGWHLNTKTQKNTNLLVLLKDKRAAPTLNNVLAEFEK